ncbi:hypothetical protein [Virgibacillus doumboii]|uniref:hypothetical protein n=1 Tax=Virgibacillus doumboii TaxID=2697503 RepID=UPI0013DEB00A|nr:hypothetical protein [Virgibacillus doumboii]
MGITLMFLILASVTPIIFFYLNKKTLAAVQTVLLSGMWLYFFQVMFGTVPAVFSITWVMFYLSLFVSAISWVMFIIDMVNHSEEYKKLAKKEVRGY